jgi:hypothetical protein
LFEFSIKNSDLSSDLIRIDGHLIEFNFNQAGGLIKMHFTVSYDSNVIPLGSFNFNDELIKLAKELRLNIYRHRGYSSFHCIKHADIEDMSQFKQIWSGFTGISCIPFEISKSLEEITQHIETASDIKIYQALDEVITQIEKKEEASLQKQNIISVNNKLLRFTTQSKENDIKFIAHVFGDSFISNLRYNGERLEGHYSLVILERISRYLANYVLAPANVSLAPLSKALVRAYQRAKRWEDELLDSSKASEEDAIAKVIITQFQKYGAEIVNELQELSVDEYIILLSGWQNNLGGGHAFYKKITKKESAYNVEIYNSGAGLQFHPKTLQWENKDNNHIPKIKYQTALQQKNIVAEQIEDTLLWTAFIEFTHGRFNHGRGVNQSSIGPNEIYFNFLKKVSPEFGSTLSQNTLWRKEQVAGTCTYKGLMALLAEEGSRFGYKRYKIDLRMSLLQEINSYLDAIHHGFYDNATIITACDSAIKESISQIINWSKQNMALLGGSKSCFLTIEKQFHNPHLVKTLSEESLAVFSKYLDALYDDGEFSLLNREILAEVIVFIRNIEKHVHIKKNTLDPRLMQSEFRLYELSIQKTARSIEKLREEKILSDSEAEHYVTQLDESHLLLKKLRDQVYAYFNVKHATQLIPETDNFTPLTPKNLYASNKKHKKGTGKYSHDVLIKIDEIYQDQNLVSKLQKASGIADELLHSDQYLLANYFIETVLRIIPSVDFKEPKVWRALDRSDTQACMSALNKLTETWLRIRFLETDHSKINKRNLKQITYMQKAFAIMHQLYSNFNVLPYCVMLHGYTHDFNRPENREPYLEMSFIALGDAHLDHELEAATEYLRINKKIKESELNPDSPEFFTFSITCNNEYNDFSVSSQPITNHQEAEVYFILDYLKKEPDLASKIKVNIHTDHLDNSEKKHSRPEEIPDSWVVTYLMSSSGNKFLPKDFILLKQQSYLTQLLMHFDFGNPDSHNRNEGKKRKRSDPLKVKSLFTAEFNCSVDFKEETSKLVYTEASLHYKILSYRRSKDSDPDYNLNSLVDQFSPLKITHLDLISGIYEEKKLSADTLNNHNIIMTTAPIPGITLVEARAVQLLFCPDDKFIQAAKVIAFFTGQQEKLNEKVYQTLGYLALFENQVLRRHLRREPIIATQLHDFFSGTYHFFSEKNNLSGMQFCIRILGLLEQYVDAIKQEGVSIAYQPFQCLETLNRLIVRSIYSDEEKAYLHYEKLFFYTHQNKIDDEVLFDILESILFISKQQSLHHLSIESYMETEINELSIRVFSILYIKLQTAKDFRIFNAWLNHYLSPIFNKIYSSYPQKELWYLKGFLTLQTSASDSCIFNLGQKSVFFAEKSLVAFPAKFKNQKPYTHATMSLPKELLVYPLEPPFELSDTSEVGGLTSQFIDAYGNTNYIHDYNEENLFEKKINGINFVFIDEDEWDESLQGYGLELHYQLWMDYKSGGIYFLEKDHSKIALQLNKDNALEYVAADEKKGFLLVNKYKKNNNYDVARFDKHYRVWKNQDNRPVYIDLPCFDLHFQIKTDDYSPHCSFNSTEYPGYILADYQYLEHCSGFENYLILTKNNEQLVLIPKYKITSSQKGLAPLGEQDLRCEIGGGFRFQEGHYDNASHHSFYTYTIDQYQELSGMDVEADIYLAYIYFNLRQFDCAQKLLLKSSFKMERYTELEVSYLINIIELPYMDEPKACSLKLFSVYCLYNNGHHYLYSSNTITLSNMVDTLLSAYYSNYNNVAPFYLPEQVLRFLQQELNTNVASKNILNSLVSLDHRNQLTPSAIHTLAKSKKIGTPKGALKSDWIKDYFTLRQRLHHWFVMNSDFNELFNFGARPSNDFFSHNFLTLYKIALLPHDHKNREIQQKLITLIRLSLVKSSITQANNSREADIQLFLYFVFFNQDKFPTHKIFNDAIKAAQQKIKKKCNTEQQTVQKMAETFIQNHIKPILEGAGLINPLEKEKPYLAGFQGQISPPSETKKALVLNEENSLMDNSTVLDLNDCSRELFLKLNQDLFGFISKKVEVTQRSQSLKPMIVSRLAQAKKINHKTLNRKIDTIIEDIESYYEATKTQVTLKIEHLNGLMQTISSLCADLNNQLNQQEQAIIHLYLSHPDHKEMPLTKNLRNRGNPRDNITMDDMIYAYYCYKSKHEPLKELAPNVQYNLKNHSRAGDLKDQIEHYLIVACEFQRLNRMQKILISIKDLDKNYVDENEKISAANNLHQDLLYEYEATKSYDLNTHFEYLIFEYHNNLVIRKAQIENIDVIANNNSKGTVIQMKPGDGKSQVVFPLLSLKLADSHYLSLFIVPMELMDSTANRLFNQLFKITRKAPVRLSWERTGLADLNRIYKRLLELTTNRQLLLVTDKELHLFFLQERVLELSYIDALKQNSIGNEDKNAYEERLGIFRAIRGHFKYKTKAIAEEADLIYDQHHQVHIAYANSIPVKQAHHDLAAMIFHYLVSDNDITQHIKFDFSKISRGSVFTKERFDAIKPLLAQKIMDRLLIQPLTDQDNRSIIGEIRRHLLHITAEQKYFIQCYISGNRSTAETITLKPEDCLAIETFVNLLNPSIKDALDFIKDELQIYLDITIDQKFDRHFGFFSDEKYLIDYLLSQFNANKGSSTALIDVLIDCLEEREVDLKALLASPKWPDTLRNQIAQIIQKRADRLKEIGESEALSSKQKSMVHNLFNAMDLAGPFYAANKPKFGSELGNPIEIINLTYKGYLISGIPKPLFKRELKRLQTLAAIEKCTLHNVELFKTRAHLQFVAMCGQEWGDLPWLGLTELQITEVLTSINASPEHIIHFTRSYILPSLYTPAKRLTSNDKMLVDLFTNEYGTFIYGMTGTPDKAETYHEGINVKYAPHVDGQTISILCEKSLHQLIFVNAESATELLNEIFDHVALKETNAIIDNGALLKDLSNRAIAEIILAKTDPAKIEAVIFFQEDQQMVIQRGVQDVKVFSKGLISPSACYTVYDEVHCTGIDIDQGLLAKAIYTKDIHTTFREDKQGPWRFRRLDKGQSIIPIMHQSLKEILVNTSQDKTLSLFSDDEAIIDDSPLNNESSTLMEIDNDEPMGVVSAIPLVSQRRQLDFLDTIIFSLVQHCDDLELDIIAAFRSNLFNAVYKTYRNWIDNLPLSCYSDHRVQAVTEYFVEQLEKNPANKVSAVSQLLPIEDAINLYINQTVGAFQSYVTHLLENDSVYYFDFSPLFKCNVDAFIDKVRQKDILPHYVMSSLISVEQGVAVEQTIMVQQQEVQVVATADTESDVFINNLFANQATAALSTPWTLELFSNMVSYLFVEPPLSTTPGYSWLKQFLGPHILGTYNFVKTTVTGKPFDVFQKKISTILIVAPKNENNQMGPRFILLANNEVQMLREFLQLPLIATDSLFCNFYFCLYLLGVGIVQNGAHSFPTNKYQTPLYQESLVKLKFLNGSLNYTETERHVLLALFKKCSFKDVSNLEDNFISNVLKYDKEGKQKFANSILKSIFTEAKARLLPQPQVLRIASSSTTTSAALRQIGLFKSPSSSSSSVRHWGLKNDGFLMPDENNRNTSSNSQLPVSPLLFSESPPSIGELPALSSDCWDMEL